MLYLGECAQSPAERRLFPVESFPATLLRLRGGAILAALRRPNVLTLFLNEHTVGC